VGSYPSSALANLTNNWITDPARSSVTAFAALTDDDSQTAQVFVDVVYTKDYYVTKIKDVYVTKTTESYITLTTESYVTWATESYSTVIEESYVTLWSSNAIKGVGVADSWALVASMVLFLAVDMLI
jgi:hypothetical protein